MSIVTVVIIKSESSYIFFLWQKIAVRKYPTGKVHNNIKKKYKAIPGTDPKKLRNSFLGLTKPTVTKISFYIFILEMPNIK